MRNGRRLLCLCAAAVLLLTMPADARRAKRRAAKDPVRQGACCGAEGDTVRNLIYMIGDGMGLAHVTMLQIAEGYDNPVSFMRAENVALIKSYSRNNRVTDSAAAGTALATGHKTNNSMLGVLPDSTAVESMMAKAVRRGMATGLVVTSYLNHATPGAFYAHQAYRRTLDPIVEQFVESGIDVAFGGGKRYFTVRRADGTTPVDRLRAKGYRVIDTLAAADTIASGKVVGLFAPKHLPYVHKGRGDYLPRAVGKALEILANDAGERNEGFMLMVEGSMIDYVSHSNDSQGILAEMRDFDRAVRVAMEFVDAHPGTLLVVTSDHETGGLTLPSGNADFTQSESGVLYKYGTESHTAVMLPVYLYGAGAERINGIMENSDLANRLMAILGLE